MNYPETEFWKGLEFRMIDSYIHIKKNRKLFEPILIYLKSLLVLGKIDEDDYDREYGKQSGFSKCCIENYISLSLQGLCPGLYMATVFNHEINNGHILCHKCYLKLVKDVKSGEYFENSKHSSIYISSSSQYV